MTKRSNGCIGKCCSEFLLWSGKKDDEDNSVSNRVEDIAKNRLEIYRGEMVAEAPNKEGDRTVTSDSIQIYTSVIPVDSNHFGCSWFNPETNLCSDYKNRPNMCRWYGKDCSWEGCGYGKKKT